MDDCSNAREKPIPHYDVRTASQNYSSIATVLAGFAFAAVVLVVQQELPPNVPNAATLREWATMAFLLAFFGCMLAAFTFAVISGEEELALRSHAMALLAGGGFAVSTIYVLWGLVVLVRLFLSPTILSPARWVFGGGAVIAPMYLILSAIDPIMAFDEFGVKRKKRIKFPIRIFKQKLVLGYIPILLGIFGRLLCSAWLTATVESGFNIILFASLVLMVLGAVWALWVSSAELAYRIPQGLGGFWIFLHSCVFGLLFVLLP